MTTTIITITRADEDVENVFGDRNVGRRSKKDDMNGAEKKKSQLKRKEKCAKSEKKNKINDENMCSEATTSAIGMLESCSRFSFCAVHTENIVSVSDW